ncbi:MAG: radical SAM protein [Nitrospinae bacterium]|nr:radical SAM protein [Nitrospinota bacterium]
MNSRVLLIIPPLTQINTPYPSTAFLTGFLKSRGYDAYQADVGIEMVLALFCRHGLTEVFGRARAKDEIPPEARQMLALERGYLDTIEPVVRFLQGHDPALAPLICRGGWLPQGPRFRETGDMERAFGDMGTTDRARYLATLYLEDLADLVRETVSPQFGLSRYAERLGTSASSFDPIEETLTAPLSFADELMLQSAWRHIEATRPSLIGLTVPFPGNLYGALRIAQSVKQKRPDIKIALGGGYANTELRRLAEPRLFNYVDYVTLDDGERPLLNLLEHLNGKRDVDGLCRAFLLASGKVEWKNGGKERDFSQSETGPPTYIGLPIDRYLSILEILNPMRRLWSDGHWNKLTVAHGCYWKQCAFCDVGLDYITRYEATPTEALVDRMEALLAETGRGGFHFVDEAAPPAALKSLALILLERGLAFSWWSNIRFEEAFTPDLCRLLAASGCIAVNGGLEAASDRLLEAMKKGVKVEQAARVCSAFARAGIMTHAYLMYGFPGETALETIESLERVRQLFAHGVIQSAFWHRFTATAHSPIGLNPEAHGIRILGPEFKGFAENDLIHEDVKAGDTLWLGTGLAKAAHNYMQGTGLDVDARRWFDCSVPKPQVRRDLIARALRHCRRLDDFQPERRLVWTGGTPQMEARGHAQRRVILPNRMEDIELRLSSARADWLMDLIRKATPSREKHGEGYPLIREARMSYPCAGGGEDFGQWLRSSACKKIREAGLLVI